MIKREMKRLSKGGYMLALSPRGGSRQMGAESLRIPGKGEAEGARQ